MRHWRRHILLTLLVLLAVILSLPLLARIDTIQEHTRRYARYLGVEKANMGIDFSHFDFHWIPLEITFRDLRLWDLDGAYRVTAGRATLGPTINLILQHNISFKTDIFAPDIYLDLTKIIPPSEVTAPSENEAPGTLDAWSEKLQYLGPPAVVISQGRVQVKINKDQVISLNSLDLATQDNGRQHTSIRLLAHNLDTTLNGMPVGLSQINLVGAVDGFPLPTKTVINSLEINGYHEEQLNLDGQVLLKDLQPVAYDGQGSLKVSLNALKYYFAGLPAFNGQVKLDFNANSKRPKIVQGNLQLTDLAVAHRPFGELGGQLAWDGKTGLNVKDLRISNMVAEVLVNADIVLSSNDNFPIDFTADIGSFSLAPLLEVVPVDFIPIILEVSGQAAFTGTLWPFKITGDADLYTDVLDVFGDHFRDQQAEIGFYTPPLKVKGPLTITADDITFHRIPVSPPKGGVLYTSGGLSWKDFVFYMDIEGQQINLPQLARLTGLEWTGRGTMEHVRLRDELSNPRVTAHLNMQEAGVAGLKSDHAELDIIYKDLVVKVENIRGQLGQGTFSAYFNTDMHGDDFLLDTKAKMQNLPLERLLPQLAENDILSLPVDLAGPTTGELALSGTFDRHMQGHVYLLTTGPAIGKLKMHSIRMRGELLGDGLTLDMWLHQQDEVIFAQAAYDYASSAGKLNLSGYDWHLSQFKKHGADLDGTVSLSGEWQIKQGQGSGSMSIKGRSLAAYGRQLGDIDINIPLKGQTFYLQGTAAKMGLNLSGQLAMDQSEKPWQGALEFLNVDYANLLQLDEIRGRISGQAQVHGRLSEPQKLFGQAAIDLFEANYQKVGIKLASPVKIEFNGDKIGVPKLSLVGNEIDINARGELDFTGRMFLDVAGDIQAEIIPLLLPSIKQADGKIHLKTNVSGTFDEPYLIGDATMENGLLAINMLGEPITDIAAKLSLIRSGITVDQLHGKLGGGKINGTGQLAFKKNEQTGERGIEPHINLELSEVTISPLGGLSSSFSGQLSLGPGKELKNELSGYLRLASLDYTKDFTLEGLMPSFTKRPTTISTLETEKEWLTFNIKLTTPKNNIIIKNNILDGAFTADLTLTGTNARLGLMGYITPMAATLKYGKNTFTVSHASLSFNDQYQISPHLQLQADTVACSDNVSMSIDWSSESSDQAIVFSGKTSEGREVPNEEVMFCLAFGLKSSAYDEYGAMDTTSTSAYLPGSLELLTAMTGLDEKAKQLIPLPIDSLRLTSGYSKRTARTAPWVSIDFKPTQQLRMGLSSSLDEVSDQKLEMEYSLSDRSKLGVSWQSASDVPVGDFGLDLQLKLEYK